jgi:hypothetical protein
MRTLGFLLIIGVVGMFALSNQDKYVANNIDMGITAPSTSSSPYITPEVEVVTDYVYKQEMLKAIDNKLEGPIQDITEIIRMAKPEIKFWVEARKVMQSWFKAMASINVSNTNNASEQQTLDREVDVTAEVSKWTPPHPQVILFFYSEDAKDYMVKQANKLIDEGHKVYRAAPERADLFSQYEVTETPMWLVIRGKEVIYRHNEPPVFPSMQATLPAQSLDDKYEEMSRALQRRDGYGIQHITPGTSRYRTPSCSNGTCGW